MSENEWEHVLFDSQEELVSSDHLLLTIRNI